ncbi:PEP-CTERM sorting domain-containing protein [Luteolibacter sp. AS25]|uniref:PEP-CTERM sorting domain-containing protein n=1 Tax=Luteolibacter sp. AS25 TaxID=3135776 RepID=UPI00398A99DB
MNPKLLFLSLLVSAGSANAVTLLSTGGTVDTGITYAFSGDVATQAGGAGQDLLTTTNTGGSFTVTFTGGAVDLTIYNTEINQAVNFDGQNPAEGYNAQVVADAGTWSYTAGLIDLTNGNAAGANAVAGLGTSTFTIGNARIFADDAANGIDVANSGAPPSEIDWGSFQISGVSSITYSFSDVTNFEGIRIDAIVPEPSSAALIALGGIAFLGRRRR